MSDTFLNRSEIAVNKEKVPALNKVEKGVWEYNFSRRVKEGLSGMLLEQRSE